MRRTILMSTLTLATVFTSCRKEDEKNYPDSLQNSTYLSYNYNNQGTDNKLKLDFSSNTVRYTLTQNSGQGEMVLIVLTDPTYTYSEGKGVIGSVDIGNSTGTINGSAFVIYTANGKSYFIDENDQVTEIEYIAPLDSRNFTAKDDKIKLDDGTELVRQ